MFSKKKEQTIIDSCKIIRLKLKIKILKQWISGNLKYIFRVFFSSLPHLKFDRFYFGDSNGLFFIARNIRGGNEIKNVLNEC